MLIMVIVLCIPQMLGTLVLVLTCILNVDSPVSAFTLAAYGGVLLILAGPLVLRVSRQSGPRSAQTAMAAGVFGLALTSTALFFWVVEWWDLPLP